MNQGTGREVAGTREGRGMGQFRPRNGRNVSMTDDEQNLQSSVIKEQRFLHFCALKTVANQILGKAQG